MGAERPEAGEEWMVPAEQGCRCIDEDVGDDELSQQLYHALRAPEPWEAVVIGYCPTCVVSHFRVAAEAHAVGRRARVHSFKKLPLKFSQFS